MPRKKKRNTINTSMNQQCIVTCITVYDMVLKNMIDFLVNTVLLPHCVGLSLQKDLYLLQFLTVFEFYCMNFFYLVTCNFKFPHLTKFFSDLC